MQTRRSRAIALSAASMARRAVARVTPLPAMQIARAWQLRKISFAPGQRRARIQNGRTEGEVLFILRTVTGVPGMRFSFGTCQRAVPAERLKIIQQVAR